MTDDQAILGCQSGDRNSFRHLVDRYKDVLYGTAFLMTSDRTLAEDQVQTVLPFSATMSHTRQVAMISPLRSEQVEQR